MQLNSGPLAPTTMKHIRFVDEEDEPEPEQEQEPEPEPEPEPEQEQEQKRPEETKNHKAQHDVVMTVARPDSPTRVEKVDGKLFEMVAEPKDWDLQETFTNTLRNRGAGFIAPRDLQYAGITPVANPAVTKPTRDLSDFPPVSEELPLKVGLVVSVFCKEQCINGCA